MLLQFIAFEDADCARRPDQQTTLATETEEATEDDDDKSGTKQNRRAHTTGPIAALQVAQNRSIGRSLSILALA